MKDRHAQAPVAWRITLKSGNDPEGFSSVHYHGTNAIADYRVIDPDAVSEPLYLNQENDEIQRQRDELLSDMERCYKMLLSEPDTSGALFKAENILREAIASVKGGAA